MKVLFICGCLEKGMDGIGDYTWKFSAECENQGISCILLSANDRYVAEMESGILGGIPCYRMPATLTWKQKGSELIKILHANAPVNWVSIQFVSFGFNQKGVMLGMTPFFKTLKGYKIHIMMHELWVGEERGASAKMKVLGILQRRTIISFLKKLKPSVIHTSIPLYRRILELYGIKSTILPLFSNVSFYKGSPSEEFDDQIPRQLAINRGQYLIGCLFGSLYHQSWDLSSLLSLLNSESKRLGKKPMMVALGKMRSGQSFWDGLPVRFPGIDFLSIGPKDEYFISYFLNKFVDFGVITTPAIISGKSGSYMTFLEHGLPVVCKQNDLSFNFEATEELLDDGIICINEQTTLNIPKVAPRTDQLKNIVRIFYLTLTEAS